MPTIDGIQITNPAMGWSHRATSEPLPSYEKNLSDLKRAGRDGVVPIEGDTDAVLLRIVVQTPRTNLESLISLFKLGKVWGDGGREAGMEFRSVAPTGFGPADQLIDAMFVIRLPGAFRRAVAADTATQTLTAATHQLSCFAARPVGQVAQWKNLLTNPDMESAGVAVPVRQNLWRDPLFTSTALYAPSGGSSALSVAGGRLTVTATGTNVGRCGITHTLAAPKAAGTYFLGVDVQSNSANFTGFRIYLYDSSTSTIRATLAGAAPTAETRLEFTATATGTFDTVFLDFTGTVIAAGNAGTFGRPYVSDLPGSFFAGSAQPILRTNLHPNSLPASSAGYLGVNNATAAYSSASMLVTCSPGSADSGVRVHTIPVQLGTPLTISTEIEAVNAGIWRINVQLSGQPVQQVSFPAFAAGEIRRVSFTYNPPATGTAAVYVLRSDPSGSETARIRKVQLEAVSAATPYFDGGSVKPGFSYAFTGAANVSTSIEWDADFSTRWAGTANASISELTGIPVVGPASLGGIAFIRSTHWKKSGSYSARLVPISTTSNVSYASYPFVGGTVPNGGTVVVTSYQEGPITGSTWSMLGKIYTNPASTTYVTPQRPNAVGEWEHRLNFGAGQGGFILTHAGLAGSGDVWYDVALLTATPNYTGPAFTGATAPPDRLNIIAWDGLADQSSSTWTVFGSWDGGLSAPIQDAVLRLKGPATGIQVADASGAWVILPDTPAGTWSRFEADTARCFQTTTDVWTGGTEVSGLVDFGGPRGVFEITPVMVPGDPSSRGAQLTVTTASRVNAVFEVRGKAAYLL